MQKHSRPDTNRLQNTPRDGPSQNIPRTPAPDEAEGAARPAFQTHTQHHIPASQPANPAARASTATTPIASGASLVRTRARARPMRHPRIVSASPQNKGLSGTRVPLAFYRGALPPLPPSSSLPISPRSAVILWKGTLRRVGRAPVAAQRARITPGPDAASGAWGRRPCVRARRLQRQMRVRAGCPGIAGAGRTRGWLAGGLGAMTSCVVRGFSPSRCALRF